MRSWLVAESNCSHCGLRYERSEQGYQVGSYAVNISLTLATITVGIAAAVAITWPATNWTLVTVVAALLAALMPIAIFPWSKALYLAIDATFRPPSPEDFDPPVD